MMVLCQIGVSKIVLLPATQSSQQDLDRGQPLYELTHELPFDWSIDGNALGFKIDDAALIGYLTMEWRVSLPSQPSVAAV